MEASRVIISDKTYDLSVLSGAKKTQLRRRLIVEYIASKPAGAIIKAREFQQLCHFSTVANTHAFLQRMLRDKIIERYEGDQLNRYSYGIPGTVRVTQPKAEPIVGKVVMPHSTPDLTALLAQIHEAGFTFSITISNKGGHCIMENYDNHPDSLTDSEMRGDSENE